MRLLWACKVVVVGLGLWGCSGQPEGSPGWLCATEGALAGECYPREVAHANEAIRLELSPSSVAWCQRGPDRPVCWVDLAECKEWYTSEHRECVKVLRLLR